MLIGTGKNQTSELHLSIFLNLNMNFSKMKSNKILSMLIVLCIILVIVMYFRYRPYSWPTGLEALGCLVSIILMATALLILWILRDEIINDLQKRNVALGLGFGLLWTFEISINNLIRPGLPLRDNIDNIFWVIIALLILITAIQEAYQTNKFLNGVKSGFWSGIANSPGMDVYFAYQTFAGAIMHLFILGFIMGLFLGIIGGFIGKTLHFSKK